MRWGRKVGDLQYETLENSRVVAKLLNHVVYLKGSNQKGWKLFDEVQEVPYYVIDTNGNAWEVL